MNEDNMVFLFDVSIDRDGLLSGEMAIQMNVRSQDHMTVAELEEFKEKAGDCASIVRNATIRMINESTELYPDEDDEDYYDE